MGSIQKAVVMSMRIPVLAAALVVAISACRSTVDLRQIEPDRSTSSSKSCRTIEHQSGATEICGQPQKIAVLGPFVLEPLVALGFQPAAFADHATLHQGPYDDPGQQILFLGKHLTNQLVNLGSAGQPSIEKLLELKPDLILGTEFNNADEYETLSKIAPTILLQWDDVETNVEKIAEAVDHPEKSHQLITDMAQRVTAGRDVFSSFATEHSNVLLLSTDSQLESIHMGSSAHGLCASLLTDLGFNLVSLPGVKENQPGAPVPISLEAITQVVDAEVIILLGFDDNNELLDTNHLEYQQLTEIGRAHV